MQPLILVKGEEKCVCGYIRHHNFLLNMDGKPVREVVDCEYCKIHFELISE